MASKAAFSTTFAPIFKAGRRSQSSRSSSSSIDDEISSPSHIPDIFSIPTHPATHALIAGEDDGDGDGEEGAHEAVAQPSSRFLHNQDPAASSPVLRDDRSLVSFENKMTGGTPRDSPAAYCARSSQDARRSKEDGPPILDPLRLSTQDLATDINNVVRENSFSTLSSEPSRASTIRPPAENHEDRSSAKATEHGRNPKPESGRWLSPRKPLPLPPVASPPVLPQQAQSMSPHLFGSVNSAPPKYDFNNISEQFEDAQPTQEPPDFEERGGRFPRWRDWIEKRALERHYDRIDAEASGARSGQPTRPPLLTNTSLPIFDDVKRKKSWGAAVDDADALSEGSSEDETASSRLSSLHGHPFGSRFLPHIPSQPLCAIYLDIPFPNSLRSDPPRILRPEHVIRTVLLVGTADGLYAMELKRPTRASKALSKANRIYKANHHKDRKGEKETPYDPKRDAKLGRDWNGNIRCVQVWSGVGLYQMSSLVSQTSRSQGQSSPSRIYRPGTTSEHDNGILLALCAPVPKAPSRIRSLFNNFSSSVKPTSSSSSKSAQPGAHNAPYIQVHDKAQGINASETAHTRTNTGIPSCHFGTGSGCAQGRPTPTNGSGAVRMWNLEMVRRIVSYALDEKNARPLDMLDAAQTTNVEKSSSSIPQGKSKVSEKQLENFSEKFRNAWASLGDPPSERKAAATARQRRQAESDSWTAGTVPISSRPIDLNDREPHGDQARRAFGSSSSSSSIGSMSQQHDAELQDYFGPEAGKEANNHDSSYSIALRMALGWVAIRASAPGGSTTTTSSSTAPGPSSLGQGPSLTSLLSEDFGTASLGGGGGSMQPNNSRGKERDGGGGSGGVVNASTPKGGGVLFYAVFEAGAEDKGAGTWYLALAMSKAILVYEAVPPQTGSSRSWSFLRELYCPSVPKAMSFCFCNTAMEDAMPSSKTPNVSNRSAPVTSSSSASSGAAASSATRLSGRDGHAPLAASTPDKTHAAGFSSEGATLFPPGGKHARSSSAVPAVYSSILWPQFGGGAAGPAAWSGADLGLFVSFGKRAVVIRISDSIVRELELASTPNVGATDAAGSTSSASPGRVSNANARTANEVDSSTSSRKTSTTEEGRATRSSDDSNRGSRRRQHTRSVSDEREYEKLSRPSKQEWIGMQPVEAVAFVETRTLPQIPTSATVDMARSVSEDGTEAAASCDPAIIHTQRSKSIGLAAANGLSGHNDKTALPSPLLFQARGTQSATGHFDTAMDNFDDSDDSDTDFDSDVDNDRPLNRFSLRDTPLARSLSQTGPRDVKKETKYELRRRRRQRHFHQSSDPMTNDYDFAPSGKGKGPDRSHSIHVSVVLFTKGSVTYLLPLPLPADLARPKPLAVVHWSDVPTSVTGLARICSLAAVSSKSKSRSPVVEASLSHAADSKTAPHSRSAAAMYSPSFEQSSHRRHHGAAGQTPPTLQNQSSALPILLNVTVLAFFASKIEQRMLQVTVEATLPTALHKTPGRELKLVAPNSSSSPSLSPSATQAKVTKRSQDTTAKRSDSQKEHEMELEYLCGLLLLAPDPKQGRVPSTIAAARSPAGTGAGGASTQPGADSSSAVLRPAEAQGHGGAWAFDWRGADDYRLFYVGTDV